MRLFKIWGMGLMLILAGVQGAWAEQADPYPDEVFELGEVVVTGTRSNSEAVASKTVVTAADIEEAGYRTLDQALTLIPGLYVRTGGQSVPRVDVRGLRTRQVTFLLNGVPINSTFDNQLDPSFISTEHIAKIKVIRGSSSVLYGEGGNAAIINIITKKAGPGIHGGFDLRGREPDTFKGLGSLTSGTDTLKLFLSGSFESRDEFLLSDSFEETDLQPDDERVNSDKERTNLYANLLYTPTKLTKIGLTLEGKKGEYGIPPDTVSDIFTNKKPKNLSKLKYERLQDLEGLGGQLYLEHAFENPLSIRSWVFVNSLDEAQKGYDDIDFDTQSGKNSFDQDTTTTRFGGALQAHYDLEKYGLVSFSLSADEGSWDSTYQERPDKNGKVSKTDETIKRYSLAAEYNVNPLDPLGLVFGLGHHWQDRSRGGTEDDFSYQVGAYYDLFPETRLKASYARKIRFPSLRRLYDEKSGNLDLEAEKTYHYQLGLRQNIPDYQTAFEVNLFRIDAEDFLEKNELTDIYENLEEYRFQGVEFILRNTSIDNLDLQASYTYLDAENRSSSIPFAELEHRPRDKVTLEGVYQLPWGMRFFASYLYVNDHYEYAKDLSEVKKLSSYHVLDVKLSKVWSDSGFKVYLGADNLLDEDYVESYALPKEGRAIYAGVAYSF